MPRESRTKVFDFDLNGYREAFYQTEDQLEQLEIINTMKSTYKLSFKDMAEILYTTDKRLYRLKELERLIPEWQKMLKRGEIRYTKALMLSSLTKRRQILMYTDFRALVRNTTHKELMKILSQKHRLKNN